MVRMTDPRAATRLLVLVRHAKAESGEERSDHDRRLTKKGRRHAAEAGRWLGEVVPTVDEVWCSSATRAVQTWEEMSAFVAAPDARVSRDLYLVDARELAERIEARTGPGSLVVVGHNPTMEQLLAGVTGELRGMRTGAVALVDLDTGARLDLWSPR